MTRDYRTMLALLAAAALSATTLAQDAMAPGSPAQKAKEQAKEKAAEKLPEAKLAGETPPESADQPTKDDAKAKGRDRAEQAKADAQTAKEAGLAKATEARGGEAPPAYQKLNDKQKAEVTLAKYDVDKRGLAIKGYDPVTYFPEGGEKPVKGDKKFEWERDGVRYRFVSEKNRELFKANPEKFAPAYGGWCAYAMAKGDYTAPDPKRYLIQNGRLMLFYDGFFGDTYEKWNDEGPKELEPLADEFWKSEIVKESEKVAADDAG